MSDFSSDGRDEVNTSQVEAAGTVADSQVGARDVHALTSDGSIVYSLSSSSFEIDAEMRGGPAPAQTEAKA